MTYGAVEIGGTKTDVAVGTSPGDLSEPHRIATTGPQETIDAVLAFFEHESVEAVGVAGFGPMELSPSSPRFGTILATPKPGWSGFDLYGKLSTGLDVPVHISTDVNGAALGEGRWGATRGMSNHVYVTVGTGIGAGIVVDGRLLAGERHPEVGHIPVRRREDDSHPGTCPYHGDCLEGMAAGPALEKRFGDPGIWAGRESVIDLAAHYVAQGMVALSYTVSPERIVVGGGVASLPGFHQRLRFEVETAMAAYPEVPDTELLISPPGLGALSGLAGGLVLAGTGA